MLDHQLISHRPPKYSLNIKSRKTFLFKTKDFAFVHSTDSNLTQQNTTSARRFLLYIRNQEFCIKARTI